MAGEPLDRLTRATLEASPGAEAVSLRVLSRGRFDTRGSTHELALADTRWGEWGPRVAADLGVRSVLAYRLLLEVEPASIASLNV